MPVITIHGQISLHQVNQEKPHIQMVDGAEVPLPEKLAE
jgi:hypothetical protein